MKIMRDGSMCSDWMRPGEALCSFAFQMTNSGDGPEDVMGRLLIDASNGKTYATSNEMPCDQCVGVLADTLNPDESKLGFAMFTLPMGLTIERLYVENGPSVPMNWRVAPTPDSAASEPEAAIEPPAEYSGNDDVAPLDFGEGDRQDEPDSEPAAPATKKPKPKPTKKSEGSSLFPGSGSDSEGSDAPAPKKDTGDQQSGDSLFPSG